MHWEPSAPACPSWQWSLLTYCLPSFPKGLKQVFSQIFGVGAKDHLKPNPAQQQRQVSESAAGCAISAWRHTSWLVDVDRGDAPYSHRHPGGDSHRPRRTEWVHGNGRRRSVHVIAARELERQRSSLGDRFGEIDGSVVAIVDTASPDGAGWIIGCAIQGIGRGCGLGAAVRGTQAIAPFLQAAARVDDDVSLGVDRGACLFGRR